MDIIVRVFGGIYRLLYRYVGEKNLIQYIQSHPTLKHITSKLLRFERLTTMEANYIGSIEARLMCEPRDKVWHMAVKWGANVDFLDILETHEQLLNPDDVFIMSCYFGHLHIARWLISAFPYTKYEGEISRESFNWACYNGHFEVVLWLVRMFSNVVGQINQKKVFRETCIQGHLDIAKWLIGLWGVLDFPRIEYNALFHVICVRGHLHVAQWFLSVYPVNGRSGEIYTFKCVCRNGYTMVAYWLLQTFPHIKERLQDDLEFIIFQSAFMK